MSAEQIDAPCPPKQPMSFTHLPPSPLDDRAEHVMVQMRDGVRLATDIYLPATDGPVPVVLTRGPYDKCGPVMRADVLAKALTDRGYAFVAQDVRGKFRSEGETVPWVTEAHDGFDTIDWITRQSWSNGRVGMTGISYMGFTQWAALSTNHPALRAISPRAAATDFGVYWGPSEPWMTYGMQYILDFYADNDLHDRGAADYDWSRRPLIDALEDAVECLGIRPPAMEPYLARKPTRHAFPEGHPHAAKPVPVLLSLGWLDPFCSAGGMRDYRAIAANPAWQPLVHLRLGPYDHDDSRLDDPPAETVQLNGIDFPVVTPEQILAWFEGELDFFDRYLKGDNETPAPPPVEYQLAHSDELLHTTTWPPPQATAHVLHLASGQGGGDGELRPQPVEETHTAQWTHNSDRLVPSATRFWPMLAHATPDFRVIADHPDVLAFRAAPQEQPLELTGPVTLHARVQTTGSEMDLFAHLLDLEPDGAARYISRGQQSLAATESTDIRMSVGDAGYVLRPGHCLLLLLCSSDYPDFLPQTGTGQQFWYATEMKATTQTLTLGGAAGARLELTTQ